MITDSFMPRLCAMAGLARRTVLERRGFSLRFVAVPRILAKLSRPLPLVEQAGKVLCRTARPDFWQAGRPAPRSTMSDPRHPCRWLVHPYGGTPGARFRSIRPETACSD